VFLPSATMAGQIAFKVHTRPGDVILIEEYGHGYYFESGSMGLISGVLPRLLKGERGILDPDQVRKAIDHKELARGRAVLAVHNCHCTWTERVSGMPSSPAVPSRKAWSRPCSAVACAR